MDGAELKRRRLALGKTQGQLAAMFGVDEYTISRWERGRLTIRAPGMLSLALLALENERRLWSDVVAAEQRAGR